MDQHNNDKEKTLPISEIFASVQGEGCFAGTVQTFIRLAGCTVGKPYPKLAHEPTKKMVYHKRDSSSDYETTVPGLPIYTEQCCTALGQEFPCDTDYRVKERLTVEEIVKRVPDKVIRVCITGGEPLMHDILMLLASLQGAAKLVHIETSGTVEKYIGQGHWVTVSPKSGIKFSMLERADELKILINQDTDIEKPLQVNNTKAHCMEDIYLPQLAIRKTVFLQPINFEHEVNSKSVKRCMDLVHQYPQFRLSLQLHKVLSQYMKEAVR